MSVIVVGVDGSDSSKRALRWAVEQARLQNATVRVVTTWQVPETIYMGGVVPESLMPELEEGARSAQAAAIAEIDGKGVPIEPRLAEGDAAQVLIDEAKEALLLVVGCRGLGTFREVILGSVSQRCAHHARCPVVIVRDGDDAH